MCCWGVCGLCVVGVYVPNEVWGVCVVGGFGLITKVRQHLRTGAKSVKKTVKSIFSDRQKEASFLEQNF